MTEVRMVRKDELYHYGVKGMKWGVRRKLNTAITKAAGSGLGSMVKTDYEASRRMAQTRKNTHDTTTAAKRAVIEAKYNRKNYKDLNLNKRETNNALRIAKKNLKTTTKENKKQIKKVKKENEHMRKMAAAGMTSGEKILYRAGSSTVRSLYDKTGDIGRDATDMMFRKLGD